MKLHEILPEDQLDEKSLKHAIAAGIVGTSLAFPGGSSKDKLPSVRPEVSRQEVANKQSEREPGMVKIGGQRFDIRPPKPELDIKPPSLERERLSRQIAQRYRVGMDLATQVVDLAFKYEDSVFPKAKDILAIVGIESSYNPESRSRLPRDPALGLMQVRPKVWNIDPKNLQSMDAQIRIGADILKQYNDQLEDTDDAIQAYNVGLTRFRRGRTSQRYLRKYQAEIDWLTSS